MNLGQIISPIKAPGQAMSIPSYRLHKSYAACATDPRSCYSSSSEMSHRPYSAYSNYGDAPGSPNAYSPTDDGRGHQYSNVRGQRYYPSSPITSADRYPTSPAASQYQQYPYPASYGYQHAPQPSSSSSASSSAAPPPASAPAPYYASSQFIPTPSETYARPRTAAGMHPHSSMDAYGHGRAPAVKPASGSSRPKSSMGIGLLAPAATERFECTLCGKDFSRAHDRKRHHETQHTKTPVTHRCKYCEKDFSRADSLRRHQQNGCDEAPRPQ